MKYKLLFLLIPFFLIFACSKDVDRCEPVGSDCGKLTDEFHGIINGEINLNLGFPLSNQVEFIVKDSIAYEQLFKNLAINNNLARPNIDFDEYTLLGFVTSGSGCSRTFRREVTKEKSKKQYVYHITVRECGECEPFETRHNWVLVPKLPTVWEVKFETCTTKN